MGSEGKEKKDHRYRPNVTLEGEWFPRYTCAHSAIDTVLIHFIFIWHCRMSHADSRMASVKGLLRPARSRRPKSPHKPFRSFRWTKKQKRLLNRWLKKRQGSNIFILVFGKLVAMIYRKEGRVGEILECGRLRRFRTAESRMRMMSRTFLVYASHSCQGSSSTVGFAYNETVVHQNSVKLCLQPFVTAMQPACSTDTQQVFRLLRVCLFYVIWSVDIWSDLLAPDRQFCDKIMICQ